MSVDGDNLRTLPVWKKDASACERLSELALLAREKPEKFERFVIVYQELKPSGNWQVRQLSHNSDLAQVVGLLQIGAQKAYEDSAA